LHLPLALGADGRKMSKQTGATALDDKTPLQNLKNAWQMLGQTGAPKSAKCCVSFLKHCAIHWNRQLIPRSNI